MPSLFDWMDALSKPPDGTALKAIVEQRNMIESLKSEEYIKTINPEDTPIGKQLAELQKLRQDFDKYRADYVADKAAGEKQRKRERRSDRIFSIVAGAISGIIGSAIGGLVVYYWPPIASLLTNLFQKISPP